MKRRPFPLGHAAKNAQEERVCAGVRIASSERSMRFAPEYGLPRRFAPRNDQGGKPGACENEIASDDVSAALPAFYG